MAATRTTLAQLWAKADRPGVRAFFLSMAALSAALLLAVYSGAAAELGQRRYDGSATKLNTRFRAKAGFTWGESCWSRSLR